MFFLFARDTKRTEAIFPFKHGTQKCTVGLTNMHQKFKNHKLTSKLNVRTTSSLESEVSPSSVRASFDNDDWLLHLKEKKNVIIY